MVRVLGSGLAAWALASGVNAYADEPAGAGAGAGAGANVQVVAPSAADGNAAAAPAAPNGSEVVDGPVLNLSGNPLTDWYRKARFERSLANDNAAVQVAGPPPAAPPAAAPAATGGGACEDGACDGRAGRSRLCHCCLFGAEGCGCRFLDAHCYNMVYAVNPSYCDLRDGQVYAAYGWGAPMTVPLAPTVTNQHNYGWGIPSSRLTPISRIAPQPGAITTAVAPR